MKKRLLISLCAVFITVISMAQVPSTINFQGILTDNNDELIQGTANLTFRIYDEVVGGNLLWEEEHISVTIKKGVFNVLMGSGTPFELDFDKPYYLSFQRGNESELDPRIDLTSVPYSLTSNKTSNVYGETNMIPSTGNVGFGTTDPTQTVDIVGTVRIRGGAPGAGKVLTSDAEGVSSWETINSPVETDPQVSASTSNKVPKWNGSSLVDGSITDNGNIGIGTTTPRGTLDVDGAGDIWLTDDGLQTTQNIYLAGHLFLTPHGTSDISFVQARRSDNSGDTQLQFRTYNNGSLIEAVRISNTGNVGIGTSGPSESLDVNGKIRIRGGAPGAGKVLTSDANGVASWAAASNSAETDPQVGATTTNKIPKWNGTALVDGSITDNGNVGIGTTTQKVKLSVNGKVFIMGDADIGTGDTFTPTIDLSIDDSDTGFEVPADGSLSMYVNNQERVSIIGNTVSLGTLSTVSKTNKLNIGTGLDSNGATNGISFWENANFGMSLGYNGSGTGTTNKISIYNDAKSEIFAFENGGQAYKAGGGSWATLSDKRLKKQVRDFDKGLNELLNIRPVYFKYNAISGYTNQDKQHVGILAQEIREVLPLTVKESGRILDGSPVLEYDESSLLYVAINAIKQQQQLIESLQNKLKASEENQAKFSAELSELKSMVLKEISKRNSTSYAASN